ncbi:MAG: hypothetical protein IJA34_05410 [Lachnospiraceae bacterium]|nr:hypothetical protein [Lachnospiraceae bacterium]
MELFVMKPKKAIILILVGIGLFLLDFYVIDGLLTPHLNNGIVFGIRAFIYSLAIVDIYCLVHDLLKWCMICFERQTWDNVKKNVEEKLSQLDKYAIEHHNTDAIRVILGIISEYSDRISSKILFNLCYSLEEIFYKKKHLQGNIAYFILANADKKPLNNYIGRNKQFYDDCIIVSNTIQKNWLSEAREELEESVLNMNERYNDLLNGILHLNLKYKLFDSELSGIWRVLISWFREIEKKDFEGLFDEDVSVLLQVFSKIYKTIENEYSNVDDKYIKTRIKELKKILSSLRVKRFINLKCKELCKSCKIEDVSRMDIDRYIRNAGLVAVYFEKVRWYRKFLLCFRLRYENKKLSKFFHTATRVDALYLFVGAEPLATDIVQDENVVGKVFGLIVSLAGVLFG